MKGIDSRLGWAGLILFSLLLAAAWAQQEPDHPRDSKLHSCTNAKAAAVKCTCRKVPGEDGTGCDADAAEDTACREWCHKDHCHCFHPECDS